MTDPYKVLGISFNATDDEVKSAYRELAKKYHPDNYANSPLADLAEEKMKEVNEAYDQIMNQRRQGNTGGQGYTQNNRAPYGYSGYTGSYGGNTSYADVRSFIMSGRIADAEQILNGVPQNERAAEWFFLKGTVLYKRGWLEEASNHLNRALQMDPGNPEYRAAVNQLMNQRQGYYGGYNPNTRNVAGCSGCDVCSNLICADCCCECMGGDLISCC